MLVGDIVNTLNVSDWIQIISIATTTLITIVSVTIALKSLNLTRKSIKILINAFSHAIISVK